MYLKNLYRSRALVTQRNPTNTDFKGEKEKKTGRNVALRS